MTMDRERPEAAIPIVEETVEVTAREVVTGRVRVQTITDTFEEVVRQELRGTIAKVTRTPIGRTLEPGETPPEPRSEDGVMIIPVFEEIIVVEKRLVLKEELRIAQEATIDEVEVPVTLRRQRAMVEKLPSTDEPEHNNGDTNV